MNNSVILVTDQISWKIYGELIGDELDRHMINFTKFDCDEASIFRSQELIKHCRACHSYI